MIQGEFDEFTVEAIAGSEFSLTKNSSRAVCVSIRVGYVTEIILGLPWLQTRRLSCSTYNLHN
ncbi:MAG: hypothetical protein KME21_00115 [Desmonostoc vinosum HA7617-LM4]|jgi:hypothetical protein|nr:hypothetical protein [Desmonostoc vinosum HA7617-LM4]